MKKLSVYTISLIMLILSSGSLQGQDSTAYVPKGQIYGDLFLNTNYNFDSGQTSFRLNRLHFAYKYNFNDNLYFNGMIESAREDYDPNTDYNGITNLFEFCLGFKLNKLQGRFGLISTELNQQQQELWTFRYVDKVFADKYGFAPTNDFGFIVIYKPVDAVQIDFSMVNGEGHKNFQIDSTQRYSLGLSFKPYNKFVARIYSDVQFFGSLQQTNLIGILGYHTEALYIGTEWNQQFNSNRTVGYQKSGISAYLSFNITKDYQFFSRYDFVQSNKPAGMPDPWNLTNDGSLAIVGLQYILTKQISLAIDYRGTISEKDNKTHSYIFFDTQLTF